MSKSRPTCRSGQLSIPDLHRGTGCPFRVGDRYEQSRKIRQRRVGEGHIWRALDSVNRLFAILLRRRKNRRKSITYASPTARKEVGTTENQEPSATDRGCASPGRDPGSRATARRKAAPATRLVAGLPALARRLRCLRRGEAGFPGLSDRPRFETLAPLEGSQS